MLVESPGPCCVHVGPTLVESSLLGDEGENLCFKGQLSSLKFSLQTALFIFQTASIWGFINFAGTLLVYLCFWPAN